MPLVVSSFQEVTLQFLEIKVSIPTRIGRFLSKDALSTGSMSKQIGGTFFS